MIQGTLRGMYNNAYICFMTGERHCKYCDKTKPLTKEYFHKGKGGFRYICKECRNNQRKEYRFKKDACHGHTIDEFRLLRKYNDKLIEEYSLVAFEKARTLLYSYKKIDKNKKLECNLSIDWLILNIINEKCIYCDE